MAGVSPESSGSGSSYTPEKGRQILKSFFWETDRSGKLIEKSDYHINAAFVRQDGNFQEVLRVLQEAAKAGDEITIEDSLSSCHYNIPEKWFTQILEHPKMILTNDQKQNLKNMRDSRKSVCTLSGGKRSKRRRNSKRRTSKRRKTFKKRRR